MRHTHSVSLHRAAWPALGAAILFGASTPFAKQLMGEGLAATSPFLLAGLLYLGSGLGLTLLRLLRDRGWKPAGLPPQEWPWLLGAITFGGVLGPLLLMVGLAHTTAATASLFLNLEAVLTAVLAWLVFRESTDRRIVLGMALIVAGGAVLAWPGGDASVSGIGPLALAGACLCWAIDNNLTRKVSASDALFIAGSKGLVAGCVNTALGFALGAAWPTAGLLSSALLVGFLGYGLSLVLFVLALRGLGTARTGAYFSTAPFVGALLSVVVFGEPTNTVFWAAAALMAAGVWLHLSEHHAHDHAHDALLHGHSHRHDAHHQHSHAFAWDGVEPHTHAHQHTTLQHSHAHFPDIHHRHPHF
ncbi:DMT family transporter [Rhodoferax saidenbachensis]|uniref:EamA family transporter n=1 Tax=Rhodoferax saidenbachensis TaxID=1484693 RepID=A0A1P8KAZ8_9BURK|nr:DMT family transporter [Rhodoferax saidenbachensis]APW43184.1 EamA family transporter [Rhodoferax saidenbachensis]